MSNEEIAQASQRRRSIGLSTGLIAATIVAGLAVRFAPLGLPHWIVKYGGSALWALMIYWIVSAPIPDQRLASAALISAALTAAIEFFKLFHQPALDSFRLTTPGILLLGRLFSAWDIVVYWFAILIGFVIDCSIRSAANRGVRR